MLYYAEIVNKPVYTEDGIQVGRLADFIFEQKSRPQITKISVRRSKGAIVIVPIEYLIKANGRITIKKGFTADIQSEDELSIGRNLLNKQIIDIKGSKLVRVNDVLIQDKNGLYIAGVDITIWGILRWLKIEDMILSLLGWFRVRVVPESLSWTDVQQLELEGGKIILKKEEEKLEKIHPADLADYLEQTSIANVDKLLDELDEEFSAEIIDNLKHTYQKAVFDKFSLKKAAQIIFYLDPDEAVDILLAIKKPKRTRILQLLDPEKRTELEYLLSLSKTPIGELLTSEYISVTTADKAHTATTKIKHETDDFSYLEYVYVVNNKNQLVGVFNLHELLLQKPEIPVYKFMLPNVISVTLTTPKELVAKKLLKYKLTALPVVDAKRRILGIVTFDDVTEGLFDQLN